MLIFKKVNFYIITFSILYFLFSLNSYSNDAYGDKFLFIKDQYLGKDKTYLKNSSIKIIIQDEVEEAHEVSMVVKIPNKLKNTNKILILVDNNPIQLVTKIFPQKPLKSVGFNIRMEQDSYVRAIILDENNIWNVASKKVIVKSPGGCSLPGCDPTKEICEPSKLGKIVMHKYKRSSGNWRLKFKINHPMDTGLVTDPNSGKIIPEYHVNWIYFENSKGELAKAQTFGALSANPTFILDFYEDFMEPDVKATDTKGISYTL
ncbi:MAG: hypothetical protein CMJ06_06000 [Pelagibacterales bacterium]|nr:hypothetical protein [Pelagibacterales bacterium]OUU61187.1 MAG: hypothetical protein CBC22_08145 [Alphaproteobacteria bacterium TMED62]|tara:strand:- start:3307 stop:4089 length:783 start_codon:yes stop_codon:yes gene_type:complete